MRKTQVTVYLDAAQTDELDARAAKIRLSRSAYVSRLIAADLADTPDRMAEQLADSHRHLRFAVLTIQSLLEASDPEGARKVAALVDGRNGEGTTARILEALRLGEEKE